MKITSINYQKTFNLGNYQSERVGCEIQLDEGDSASGLLDTARSIVENWHQVNNPQLYGEQPPENPATVPTEKPVRTVLDDIMACTTLEGANGLKGYKMLASTNSEWKQAWNEKFAELSNNQ